MVNGLGILVIAANSHVGSWRGAELADDIRSYIWQRYDPDDDLVYLNIDQWDDLLERIIDGGSCDELSKDEVLEIIFGLIHRGRIVEGLWWSMFERGVMQKLLVRLLLLEIDESHDIQL